jgi:hypothetical protein
MVDYNQALALDDALVRGRALDENIYWLEELIRHDDYVGTAKLARELKVPIQIGENFSPGRHGYSGRAACHRLCHAGSGTNWRSDRWRDGLICAFAQTKNVVASFSRSQRISCRHAYLPFPRICRLGQWLLEEPLRSPTVMRKFLRGLATE